MKAIVIIIAVVSIVVSVFVILIRTYLNHLHGIRKKLKRIQNYYFNPAVVVSQAKM